jgi:hypothetical protein
MTRLNLSAHFTSDEAACKCCGVYHVDQAIALAQRLERVRDYAGPIIVRSWHRCVHQNRRVGGVVNSAHLRSLAVDIFCATNHHRFLLVSALYAAGFTRIGVGESIIHADIDSSLPPNVLWHYYDSLDHKAGIPAPVL